MKQIDIILDRDTISVEDPDESDLGAYTKKLYDVFLANEVVSLFPNSQTSIIINPLRVSAIVIKQQEKPNEIIDDIVTDEG